MIPTPADFLVAAVAAIAAGLVSATSELELPQTLVGWLGVLGTMLGAVALYRAGSIRAWKETAEGRGKRVEDLERELAELRTELAIPERIEGIVGLMGEMAVRQDAAASRRMEEGLKRLREQWAEHNTAAEARAARIEAAILTNRQLMQEGKR